MRVDKIPHHKKYNIDDILWEGLPHQQVVQLHNVRVVSLIGWVVISQMKGLMPIHQLENISLVVYYWLTQGLHQVTKHGNYNEVKRWKNITFVDNIQKCIL